VGESSSRGRGSRPVLPRSIWLLAWTSFFTDTASEAVYPLLPIFLARTIGASAFSIGVIEGAAEALNSVLRIVSGRISDRFRVRKPLVLAGYGLSTMVRPLVAFATTVPHVLVVRLADRVGKGIRGAPRDALLAAWADPAWRGYVFGLHRAMDHAGAVVGPLLASAFLWAYPEQYRTLFLLTIIPGAIAVMMLVPVREVAPDSRTIVVPDPVPAVVEDFSPAGVPAALPGVVQGFSPAVTVSLGRPFFRYLGILLLFALGNSTDAFLLLKLSDAGIAAVWIPLLWAALHVVKAGASPFGGLLSDHVDRRRVIGLGWILYAVVYLSFARASTPHMLIPVFLIYGLYYALTEGGEKAIVADIAPPDARGLAFGWYNAVTGIGSLAASLGFGLIWKTWGSAAAFQTGAGLALVAAVFLVSSPLPRPRG
jgi:MFS family permease